MTISLEPGDVIASKYRVGRQLGEGGMGTVMAATDSLLDRPVAIKVLSIEHRKNDEAVSRFLQEARAAVKLQSEHVVKVYDVGTRSTGSPYIVMEMLRGADLSKVLDAEGPLTVSDAITFVLQACEPVAEAHVLGIVHRDLKPANLFRMQQTDGTPSVKVLDFGISKLTMPAETLSPSFTRTSLLLGSPTYMSPEQLRNAKDVDGRADIWALGTILYELLVGRAPFEAESLAELSAQILREPAPAPSNLAASPLPEGLDAVILKAIEKNRDDRYATVTEFAMALAPFAPRRMWPTIEKIARLQNSSDLSNQLPELAPTAPPQSSAFARSVGEATSSWGMTAYRTPKRSAVRRLSLAVAGVALLGLAALLVNVTRSSPAASAIAHPAAAAPAPTPAAPSEAAPPPAEALEPLATTTLMAAEADDTVSDTSAAADAGAEPPSAPATSAVAKRARTGAGYPRPSAQKKAPQRAVFGGRK